MQSLTDLPGYRIINQLYAGSRTLVYQSIREVDQAPVILKLLREEYPTFGELVRFRNQYIIAENLAINGVVKPLELLRYRQSYVLVMEDVGGVSLANYLKQLVIPISISDFLGIGLQLVQTLDELHHSRVIHKDIKPANILIQPQTKQVKLIDFSISSLLPRESQEIPNPHVLEGTLAYLSPEQTGRMNRGIDYRSDFYSLGVTFYEMLTGQLPFVADEPMEIVHCHIAKSPIPVAAINQTVPVVISNIVSKLMAKNPEERYQSALGLKYDLERCLELWQQTDDIVPFDLGQQDICDRFLIPEKLYGREAEVQELLAAFDRINQGTAELMLVAGFSGIGKTAVVNEVHKPIVRQRGYFIKGKFDQFNRNIPFWAFVQAFRNLMEQLLTESNQQLQQWQAQILQALGENGQVILEVIPELAKIIGIQPPVPELSGSAAQNRFNLLFQKFLQVFTTKSHPLVIFLDDLQWADSASLQLIQLLMSESLGEYLLIIGAYRDNEVSPAHPLMLMLDEIRKKQAIAKTITLKSLNQLTLNQLVSDTLSCPEDAAFPLSKLIYQKTQGNPFFSTQFLRALHEDGLIEFNFTQRCWQCDITQINQQALTDDVVEFMAFQLQRLPKSTQSVLQLAACIGNQFDLATLAIVSERSPVEVAACLWKALQSGLIFPQSEIYKFYQEESAAKNQNQSDLLLLDHNSCQYKFLHDRVQQAAYSLIPDSHKKATHLQIGRLLLQETTPESRKDNIFTLVNQLNQGAELLTLESEKYQLAQLNLIAGQKAKTSAAFTPALGYLETGLGLLTYDSWQQQYPLTLALYELAAEAAYLNGDFERMEQRVDVVLQQAKTSVDKMTVYALKIQAYVAQVKKLEALEIGLQALELLGISLPKSPDFSDIQQALTQTAINLDGKHVEDLIHLPLMTDIEKLTASRMLMSVGSPTYQVAPMLFPLVICQLVNLSIQYGNSPFSSYGYACYGCILNAVFQDMKLGYQFGKLALSLAEKFNAPGIKASAFMVVASSAIHSQVHLRETLPILWESYQSGLASGNWEFAGYAAALKSMHSYFIGQELTVLEREMATMTDALTQLNQQNTLTDNQIFQQSVLNLLNPSEYPDNLQGEVYDEGKSLLILQAANDKTTLHYFYLSKLILGYLFAEYERARENALQAEKFIDGVQGFFIVPLFHFYDSLVHLAIYQSAPDWQQEQWWNRVTNNQEKIQPWAIHAPMNFQHKFDLVAAEQCRIKGKKIEAMELYDRAIAGASENEYIQEEAIANELAAQFYLEWGREKVATTYLQAAYYSYAHWGARAKVEDLERRYPQLLAPILQQRQPVLTTTDTIFTVSALSNKTTTSSTISAALDLATVIKASQILSSEIELERLLVTLLQVIIENAGAEKCVLVLLQDEGLLVKGMVRAGTQSIALQCIPVEESQDIPLGLIYSVKNSLQPVVLAVATAHPLFANDPYILRQQPQSILCSPILNRGQFAGILYLENNLTTGAFTSDRVELLNLLCTQAAISLENAQLYAREQQKTQALQTSLAQLQQSELRFQELFAKSADAILLWNSNGFIDCNQAMVDLLGYTHREQLYSLQPSQISPEFQPDGQSSLDQTNVIVPEVLRKGSHQVEWMYQRANNETFWAEVVLTPILYKGEQVIHSVSRDISDRKRTEAELRASQQRLSLLIQQSPMAIIEWDSNFQVRSWNSAAERIFGFTAAEALGRSLAFLIPNEAVRLHVDQIVAYILSNKRGNRSTNKNLTKAGNVILCDWYNNPIINEDGEIIGAASMVLDITDRQRTETERQQKSEELEAALQKLQQAQLQIVQSEKMSALGNLVAGVAHEINNPIGFLGGNIQPALDYINDLFGLLDLYQQQYPNADAAIQNQIEAIDLAYIREDLPKLVGSMREGVNRIRDISTSLRTFSRADSDRPVAYNIHDGINSTILILKHRLKVHESRPAIEIVKEYGKLPLIECFPGQLNQVFMNILANAIDALEESNIGRNFTDIQTQPNRIQVKTEIGNGEHLPIPYVVVRIQDNGLGMSEQVKQKIFDHLFTTKVVGKGTGLGLAIAQQIVVEKHQGAIVVNSTVGEGSEFVIMLPIKANY